VGRPEPATLGREVDET
jgi:hypothetical protein